MARRAKSSYVVFVSHAWHDRWVATQIARLIKERTGAEVFFDVFDVEFGDRIEEKVQEGIVKCSELVALVTPWSVKRTWLWTEIGGAWGSKKRVVGLLYGVTLDEIQENYGGTACLNASNCGHINDLDAYLEQLAERAKV